MLKIKNESGYPFVRRTVGSIGFDLYAVLEEPFVRIRANGRTPIDTGISIALPEGWGAFVMPRSGLGFNHGVVAITGVVDRDYRGRIKVLLHNTTNEPYRVQRGDRIAQLVPVLTPDIRLVMDLGELDDTERGSKGFGSTGR